MYFITGTDTGVGKTIVTAALMVALQERGIRCAPVKPVQSGTADGSDDLGFCISFARPPYTAGQVETLRMVSLPLPASPHLAAREAGLSLTVQSLENKVRDLSKVWNVLLVEGAGGLLVPLNARETTLDLIKALGARPVVVARDTLGTLNHTALTLRVLAAEGIQPAAVAVVSSTPVAGETDRLIREDNLREIARIAAPTPVVGIPCLPAVTRETLLAAGRPLADRIFDA